MSNIVTQRLLQPLSKTPPLCSVLNNPPRHLNMIPRNIKYRDATVIVTGI